MPMPHMLILESYPPTGQAFEVILKREGWDVTLSQTAQETLEALQHHSYDVLLVDLDMATGDGWRLLQALHLTHHSAPIIAMLGQESGQQQRAYALGVCMVLPKPVGRNRLLTSATAVLENV
jgi:CheY-like chemotaxis protein